MLARLLHFRGLLLTLTARELKARYRGSLLGFLWSLVNPLLLLAVYTLVFDVVFKNRAGGAQPYAVFLISGLFPWIWFSSALLDGTGLGQYMDAISSGNDVTEGKPNPEVFLIAFRRVGVDPRNGVVVEDAPAGVLGGKRAGAAVLAVTTTQDAETLRKAGADRVADTLEGFTVADMEALVQANQARARD